ncbi:hypothetical protein AXG93_4605s1270 [Marchantia polymorpha subsp. ruderalis]|uniref:Uncharacterized protein n=1 Tax=Marchantia polymorpha subsp. ruderalis TaxID=1480154 RepID=A0A176WNS1_MARPO|nr:hypothetical protein AXG93_4605s1270 [Marchantia polymorpha subsp. ruderalis]
MFGLCGGKTGDQCIQSSVAGGALPRWQRSTPGPDSASPRRSCSLCYVRSTAEECVAGNCGSSSVQTIDEVESCGSKPSYLVRRQVQSEQVLQTDELGEESLSVSRFSDLCILIPASPHSPFDCSDPDCVRSRSKCGSSPLWVVLISHETRGSFETWSQWHTEVTEGNVCAIRIGAIPEVLG